MRNLGVHLSFADRRLGRHGRNKLRRGRLIQGDSPEVIMQFGFANIRPASACGYATLALGDMSEFLTMAIKGDNSEVGSVHRP